MNFDKEQGFTMIELVMVIVILGILAATALPKFIDMTTTARIATLKGLEGAINGAKSIVKAGYLINPSSPVTMSDGTTVSVSTSGTNAGLPTATADGIGSAIDIGDEFTVSYASSPNVATFSLKPDCLLVYTESTAAINQTTTGC